MFEKYYPNQRLSAADLNRIQEVINRLDQWGVSPPLILNAGPYGRNLSIERQRFTAVITANPDSPSSSSPSSSSPCGSFHTFAEVSPAPCGGYAVLSGGIQDAAYELNGRITPVGKLVEVFPWANTTNDWAFLYCCQISSSSSSSSPPGDCTLACECLPASWTVEIAGVIDADCDCSVYNTPFVCSYLGDCVWASDWVMDDCTSLNRRVEVRIYTPPVLMGAAFTFDVQLTFDGGGAVDWIYPSDVTIDCEQPLELGYLTDNLSGECDWSTSTATITGDCGSSSTSPALACCEGVTLPDDLTVTVTSCSQCVVDLNGQSFTISRVTDYWEGDNGGSDCGKIYCRLSCNPDGYQDQGLVLLTTIDPDGIGCSWNVAQFGPDGIPCEDIFPCFASLNCEPFELVTNDIEFCPACECIDNEDPPLDYCCTLTLTVTE